jgi:ribosomal protein S18 acetylase RimI-like enzyme
VNETVRVRPLDELDITEVADIAERSGGRHDPGFWEDRVAYFLRRDPEGALVAEVGGRVAGFMLGEVRSGEFGIAEPTGWIEVLGVDPGLRGRAVGRLLAEALEAHFRARGAVAVRTLVDETMPGIAGFFASLGYAPAPMRPFVKRL